MGLQLGWAPVGSLMQLGQLAGPLVLTGPGGPHSCLVVGASYQLVAVVTGPHTSIRLSRAHPRVVA